MATMQKMKQLEDRAAADAIDELNRLIEKHVAPIQRALASGDPAVIEKMLTGGTVRKVEDLASMPSRIDAHVATVLKGIEPAMAKAIAPDVALAVEREISPLRDRLAKLAKRVEEVAKT